MRTNPKIETLTREADDLIAANPDGLVGQDRARVEAIAEEIREIEAAEEHAQREARRADLLDGVATGRYSTESGDGTLGAHYQPRHDPFASVDRMTVATPDSEVRSAALIGIERWDADDELKEQATKVVERTSEPRGVGEHILRTSNPHYMSAFQKYLRDPEGYRDAFTSEERGAWVAVREMKQRAALDTAGAVLPSPLDPSIVLTSTGTNDAMRQIARVDQTTAAERRYITSAGVTSSFDAELAEVSDDTPTLTEVTITTRKAQGFVQASIEAAMDQPDIALEVARLFADDKAALEGSKFISGAAGSNEPIGIQTALAGGASEVAPATAEVFAAADVFGLLSALPARFQPNARYVAELSTLHEIQQMETTNGAPVFPGIDATNPVIARRQVSENSNVDAFSAVDVGATANNYILFVGDWSQYVILDRIGMSVEFIPHLLNTANNLPDGRRGWYAHWRVGADSLVDNAFRMLNLATTL